MTEENKELETVQEVTVAEETVAEAAEAANEEVEAAKPARRSRSRKKKVETKE